MACDRITYFVDIFENIMFVAFVYKIYANMWS